MLNKKNMAQLRGYHGFCYLNNNIYAIGGVDKNHESLVSCERYDL